MEDNKMMKPQMWEPGMDDEEEIDILDLLGYYMSKLPLLIAALVIGVLMVGFYSYYQQSKAVDTYTAKSKIYVIFASGDAEANLSDVNTDVLNIGKSLAKDCEELIKSRPVLEDVIGKLGLKYSDKQLAGMIGVAVVEDTRIMEINATSADPQEAMEIANQTAESAKEQIPKVLKTASPSIVEKAVMPTHSNPRTLSIKTAILALVPLILLLGVLTVKYFMDDTIRSPEDLEKLLDIAPLAVIPEGGIDDAAVPDDARSAPSREEMAVFGADPRLPNTLEEAFNHLRVNIGFLGDDIRKIMVVSADPDEGKSFVAMNLWKRMARARERSVLVEANMRKSVMVKRCDISRRDGKALCGLTDYLSGDRALEDCVLTTDLEHGDILPNVKDVSDPSLLLEGERFGGLLDALGEKARFVIVDVPPLGLFSDGASIGHLCDGAILVVRAGVTHESAIRNAIAKLDRAGCPLLGVVLNRVGAGSRKCFGRYFGKYYGRHYGKGYCVDGYRARKA